MKSILIISNLSSLLFPVESQKPFCGMSNAENEKLASMKIHAIMLSLVMS